MNYSRLPPHCQDGMRRYIEEGLYPGDFLQAVLANELAEAFGCADSVNADHMRDYAMFLYNDAPRAAWGSRQAIDDWCRTHRKKETP